MSAFASFLNWATFIRFFQLNVLSPQFTDVLLSVASFYLSPNIYSCFLRVIYLINSFVQNRKLSYYGSFSEPGRTHPLCRLSYLWARGASKAGGEWRSLLTRFTISPARLGSKPPKANTFSICETWASRSGTLLVLTTSVLENSQVMNSWWENHF